MIEVHGQRSVCRATKFQVSPAFASYVFRHTLANVKLLSEEGIVQRDNSFRAAITDLKDSRLLTSAVGRQ